VRRFGKTSSAVAVAAALVGIVAGCGKSSASPEEQWASSVCTAFGDWKSQIQTSANDIKAQVQSPQQGMVATIKSDVQSAGTATNKLASNLKSLPPLTSDQGTQAKQQVNNLATQAESTVNQVKTATSSLPANAGAAQTVKALAPFATQFQSLATQASSTLSSVKASSSALKKGFQDADSCKQFNG
jgi:hypothetical protein